MDERYSRIYSLPENLYAQGAPVVVSAGALLKDNETNWLLGQLKLRSISNKPIKLVKVELTCFDAMGREVSPAIVFDYLDLNVFRGSEFGSQTPIRMSNAAIRGYTVKVVEVGFADNTIWYDNGGAWEHIPPQTPISYSLNDEMAVNGYKSLFGNGASWILSDHKDIWCCSCGAINHQDEERCYKCNVYHTNLASVDVEALAKEGIYAGACKMAESNNASQVMAAKEEFSKIQDYKDSNERITVCDEKLAEMAEKKKVGNAKRKKIIKLASILAGCLVVLGLLGYFVGYPLVAYWNGNYKVYIDMYKIEEFTVPDGVETIETEAFAGCESLSSVTIPEGVTSIGIRAFQDCTGLTSIVIPDSVKTIEGSAFYNCNNLDSVTMGTGVTSIGSYAFRSNSHVLKIYISDIAAWCEMEISENAYGNGFDLYYNGDLIKDLVIPEGVTKIGNNTFAYLESITSITIPSSVRTIGEGSFKGCDNLVSVNIPNGVVSIGKEAFRNCDGLKSVIISDSVTTIGEEAFALCLELTNIQIGKNVKRIEYQAFYLCRELTSIRFNGTKSQWNSIYKVNSWNQNTGNYIIYCTDGNLKK